MPDFFDPDESERRELFFVPSLHKWLYQDDKKMSSQYKTNIRVFLSRFVKGKPIDNKDYMKSWKDDIFELRVQLQKRKESTRIFGAFVAEDCFLCTSQRQRGWFDRAEGRWDYEISRTFNTLTGLDFRFRPVRSVPFSNCVTFNFTDMSEV